MLSAEFLHSNNINTYGEMSRYVMLEESIPLGVNYA